MPCVSSSATTKISWRAGSMTGVPVIPTLGEMLPHGRAPAGTGCPMRDHSTEPVAGDSA